MHEEQAATSKEQPERWAQYYDHPVMVSTWGRVKSLAWGRGRILKPFPIGSATTTQYPAVNWRRDGQRFCRTVHRMVLETFVGPRPFGLQARHLDGNTANPRLDNLCWGTKRENDDKQRHGKCKLNPVAAEDIYRRLLAGWSTREAAELYGVSRIAVGAIGRGKTWGHVTHHNRKGPSASQLAIMQGRTKDARGAVTKDAVRFFGEAQQARIRAGEEAGGRRYLS